MWLPTFLQSSHTTELTPYLSGAPSCMVCLTQIAGALLVVAGVVTAAWPSQGASVFTEVNALMLLSGAAPSFLCRLVNKGRTTQQPLVMSSPCSNREWAPQVSCRKASSVALMLWRSETAFQAELREAQLGWTPHEEACSDRECACCRSARCMPPCLWHPCCSRPSAQSSRSRSSRRPRRP